MMEAIPLPTKRKFSWRVFLIVLVLTLVASLLIRAILGNGLLALAFGWLYRTYGLESAMLTHFFLDVLLYVILPLAV